jgi:F0F1-type ATP synthase membrane subunit a
MAKYQQPFKETQALYDEKIRASGLDAYINITSSNKAKVVTLVKPNELFNYVTKMISISLLMRKF